MEKSRQLIKLAKKLSNKYAGINAESLRPQVETAIWTALRNASTSASHQLMPFFSMVKQDGVTLTFDVIRDDNTITVDSLQVQPPGHLEKYQVLAQQVKDYLEQFIELYPSVISGVKIEYHNFRIHLQYPDSDMAPIAQQ
jgi:hypothetical protein